VGNVGKWTLVTVLCGLACAKGQGDEDKKIAVVAPPDAGPPADPGNPNPKPVDAGVPDPVPDAGPPPAKAVFGTPGPWPIANVTYGAKDGIQESPVVGVSSDEPVRQADGTITQNLWVATNQALYLLRPGDKKFTRFDGMDGLHLPGFNVGFCHDKLDYKECPNGSAAPPGINEIVGGGSGDGYLGEVFVGYWGFHTWDENDGTSADPWRHSGKLDRVRIKADNSGNPILKNGKPELEVIRFDMVSNNTPEYWHNKTVFKMVYDHFVNKHELYVGCDHGIDKISPDKWKESVGWFLAPGNQQSWMSDHLHAQTCFHHACGEQHKDLRISDWRGLAIDAHGDLWNGGRYAASRIRYVADNTAWWATPRPDGSTAHDPGLGDEYTGCFGSSTRPVFCPPLEGDPVNISAVTVAKDGKIWFSSGTLFNEPQDVPYGIASLVRDDAAGRNTFTYYDPVHDVGLPERDVRDMIALLDGRLVVAGLRGGLVIWDPATGNHVSIGAAQGISDDRVIRIQLDTMVDPPALQIATRGGATVLRVLP
jgi:hypothetical protein